MLLASTSSSAYALLGVLIGLTTGILGATWRIGNKVGKVTTTQNDHDRRLVNLEIASEINRRLQAIETHLYQHDAWHMNRGDK